MMMFDNGLFNYFIPEIIMAIGYLICLIGPNINTEQTKNELTPITVQISASTLQTSNTYKVTFQDLQQSNVELNPVKELFLNFKTTSAIFHYTSFFEISDGLNFKVFCRPPPNNFI